MYLYKLIGIVYDQIVIVLHISIILYNNVHLFPICIYVFMYISIYIYIYIYIYISSDAHHHLQGMNSLDSLLLSVPISYHS